MVRVKGELDDDDQDGLCDDRICRFEFTQQI
jgi:hypothetical protein